MDGNQDKHGYRRYLLNRGKSIANNSQQNIKSTSSGIPYFLEQLQSSTHICSKLINMSKI